ncbi:phytoene desaturase family protein [Cerasicoccus arenae]|uniref:Phytoene desaturase n=1 Tax=Cerasicoccus arenae TaxID=424488 RepID=A0A8J3DI08_9BACT|nr:phytoene desaturase family protein [Cerasicoccus arenae]MBK1857474.1 phytoene desaturase [Cerasicoccus arenae]GHB95237.1 phytoene desaturase [Cerasicoccus arenae]
MADPVIVLGGGLGGLSAAIHLACAGERVTLLEQNTRFGGKCNLRQWEGFQFDTGPSLLTMPFVVDELFAHAGRRREDYLEFTRVAPACCYFFPNGRTFDAPGTLEGFREAVARDFPKDLAGFDRFMKYCRNLWEVSGPLFLFNRLEPAIALKIRPKHALAGLAAMRPWTLRQAVEHYFKAPELRQLFSRYATYNGSDPWRTPATFNVISYVEMAFGSWHIQGGVYQLVEALVRLAGELGVELRSETKAEALRFNTDGMGVAGVELADGTFLPASQVVVNADGVAALTGSLFGGHPKSAQWRRQWEAREASSSGGVQLLAIKGNCDALACHNIFFNADYRQEFTDLFDRPQPLRDPTIYLSAPCKIDPTQAPAGHEAWFLLVNAPDCGRSPEWPEDYDARVRESLAKQLPWFNDDRVLWRESLPPSFLRDAYGAWRGAIYGPASNDRRSAFLRISPRGPVPGVFFAGGAAHPGGGIPLVLTSGRLAAELVAK